MEKITKEEDYIKPKKKMGRQFKTKPVEQPTDDGVVIGFEKLAKEARDTFLFPMNFLNKTEEIKKPSNTLLKYIAVVVTVIMATMIYCSYEVYLATQDIEISS